MTEEEKYQEELKAAGVELPEAPKVEEVPTEEPKTEETPQEPLQEDKPKEPEQPRKRSIYDDYREEKSDRKAAEARAQQAEQERDELRQKLEAATAGNGSDTEAGDDALAYAQKVGADPDLVKRIIDDARKGIKSEVDETLKKDLEDFKAWKAQNSKAIEQQMFETEFKSTIPALKRLFPQIDDTALEAVKTELDKLSHTKDWHDKPLDYIAFKNEETLSALVSPKKRGMESKGRRDVEPASSEFDPNADYSKLSPAEKVKWEEQYRALGKTDGLITDSQGRKLIV